MSKFVIWTSELDSRLSKKYGRVVPRNLAVERPSIEEIEEAAKSLGFKVLQVEREKLNPKLSGIDEDLRTYGRIIIESPYGKAKTLKIIAQKIRELRRRR
ncbi:signal recognition particle protein Srp19 [Pyrococcus abyssi]|uniref:Signal recognition particle 19 kDa protein n=1 Tax=Pyrococcus abyssi (strain GE5 / Orsay) TaxID=272844 RepID=SRP19_PYRAB|nr:signal recognition particle protein Srp19 [Pyrococcus abyssi]Q9V1J9.1 RecName: Full=Signal recognition particle 19 kDa protein; Short=SRP19 [Pyrococcus abyssi GE5]CAB49350.1 srp19 signal recognition particle, subunit SRP19, putative [Pyrococcus abyssi GE5]CCE69809.1 TPA: signal recognition particle protein Srp19 [Pyrococcus abyssi GE5]